MSTQSENVCSFVRRRKSNLAQVLGGKCILCGFDKFQEALEFHHVNPEEKDFTLTSSNMKNLADQLVELRKCVLVCANCHRGIHANYYTVPENWQSYFNEELASNLLEELKGKHYYCKNCGKEISRRACYCMECAHVLQQRTDRPSREELKSLIRKNSFSAIGKMFGVSDNAIRKWCVSNNLPSKKLEINSYSDEDWAMI